MVAKINCRGILDGVFQFEACLNMFSILESGDVRAAGAGTNASEAATGKDAMIDHRTSRQWSRYDGKGTSIPNGWWWCDSC